MVGRYRDRGTVGKRFAWDWTVRRARARVCVCGSGKRNEYFVVAIQHMRNSRKTYGEKRLDTCLQTVTVRTVSALHWPFQLISPARPAVPYIFISISRTAAIFRTRSRASVPLGTRRLAVIYDPAGRENGCFSPVLGAQEALPSTAGRFAFPITPIVGRNSPPGKTRPFERRSYTRNDGAGQKISDKVFRRDFHVYIFIYKGYSNREGNDTIPFARPTIRGRVVDWILGAREEISRPEFICRVSFTMETSRQGFYAPRALRNNEWGLFVPTYVVITSRWFFG